MSQENEVTVLPQESPHFWAKHHDIIPIFIIALMAVSFLMYWKTQPSALPRELAAAPHSSIWQFPAYWGRYEWGKYFLMPLSNFLLFMYLLLSRVLPLLSANLWTRHLHIKQSLQSFEERSDEIADRYRHVKEKLAHVDEEVAVILSRAQENSLLEKTKIRERAQKQAQRIVQEAELLGSQEVRKVQQELQAELIERAFAKAESLLLQTITSDDQARLERDYLQHVGKLS